ncbi:MAG TPA: hypothetical protein VHX13_09425 [Acidobacteriaceae bacterium]|nr:hypothetical protein [Acidobacteriaceae bacterium]
MISACLEFLFGCVHNHQTRAFTLNKSCYTVCLDCGRELPYSWSKMRPLKPAECPKGRLAPCEEMSAAA